LKNKILIITNSKDLQGDCITKKLDLIGVDYLRFNVDEYPLEIDFQVGFNYERGLTAKITRNGNSITQEDVLSVLYFPSAMSKMDRYNLTQFESQTIKDFVVLENDALLNMSFSAFRDSFWLIEPNKVKTCNKLQDLILARELGLSVPNSLIVNHPEHQKKFLSQNDNVVLKTMKGVLKKMDGETISTFAPVRRIFMEEVSFHIPMFLQVYIEKKYELRITIVGDQIFPCIIDSQKSKDPRARIDWRIYDFDNVEYKECKLPKTIEQKCLAFMRERGLRYSAIDMIVTPEDDYVFLESNSHGIWHWVEMLTDMETLHKTVSGIVE